MSIVDLYASSYTHKHDMLHLNPLRYIWIGSAPESCKEIIYLQLSEYQGLIKIK